jgi:hypothetical protein
METKSNKGIEVKSFDSPEEVRKFEKGKLELVNIGGAVIGRGVFQPGWRWSKSVNPFRRRRAVRLPIFNTNFPAP